MPPVVFLGASFVERGSPIVTAYTEASGVQAAGLGERGASLRSWMSIAVLGTVVAGQRAIVVDLGGNETVTPTAADIERHDQRLRAVGYVPRWVITPTWPDEAPADVRAKRAAMRAAIRAARVSKLEARWAPHASDLAGDGVHLRADAYAAFGRAIAAAELRGGLVKKVLAVVAAVGAVALAWKYA